MKLQRCSLLQLTIHVILIFAIGFIIGNNLLPASQQEELRIINSLFKSADRLEDTGDKFNRTIDYYEEGRHHASTSHLIRYDAECMRYTGVQLSANQGRIIFEYSRFGYKRPPHVIVSVNGINFKPDPVPGYGSKTGLFFKMEEITEKRFVARFDSNFKRFGSTMLENAQVCFMLLQDPKDFVFSLQTHRPLAVNLTANDHT
jgi:hypothetical protein